MPHTVVGGRDNYLHISSRHFWHAWSLCNCYGRLMHCLKRLSWKCTCALVSRDPLVGEGVSKLTPYLESPLCGFAYWLCNFCGATMNFVCVSYTLSKFKVCLCCVTWPGVGEESKLTAYSEYSVLLWLNPLECKGNYSAALNNMKSIDWPLMGGLLHLIQRGDWAGCRLPRPLFAVPNIYHLSTASVPIIVLLYSAWSVTLRF